MSSCVRCVALSQQVAELEARIKSMNDSLGRRASIGEAFALARRCVELDESLPPSAQRGREIGRRVGKSKVYVNALMSTYRHLDASIMRAWELGDPDLDWRFLNETLRGKSSEEQLILWSKRKTRKASQRDARRPTR